MYMCTCFSFFFLLSNFDKPLAEKWLTSFQTGAFSPCHLCFPQMDLRILKTFLPGIQTMCSVLGKNSAHFFCLQQRDKAESKCSCGLLEMDASFLGMIHQVLRSTIRMGKDNYNDLWIKQPCVGAVLSHLVVSDSFRPHGLQPVRLPCPWNSPGKNTEEGCHFLLQGIFLTQGPNPCFLHCRQILYHVSHQGSPRILEWVVYPFSRGLPNPAIKPGSPALQADSLPAELPGSYHIYIYMEFVYCSCVDYIPYVYI